MKLRIVVVGRDRGEPIVEAAEGYRARLRHYFPVELVEVKEEPLRKGRAVAEVKRAEAERIRKVLGTGDLVVALDERGRALTSVALSKRLDDWAGSGTRQVSFVLGGPSGLCPDFLREVRERWALSSLTLPHRVARLVLVEQLYRAATILRGEPYHK